MIATLTNTLDGCKSEQEANRPIARQIPSDERNVDNERRHVDDLGSESHGLKIVLIETRDKFDKNVPTNLFVQISAYNGSTSHANRAANTYHKRPRSSNSRKKRI